MKIDSYAYIGFWPYWPIKTRSVSDLIGLMDKWSIDKAVVSSLRSVFAVDVDGGNREVYEAMKKWPDRLVGCATLDLSSVDDALRQIAEAEDEGIRGFRLYPLYNGYSLKKVHQKIVNRLIGASIPIIIPYRLIMNWSLPTLSSSEIESFIPKVPDLPIILCGGNYPELAATMDIMLRFENVHFETSCLQTWNGIKNLVDMIGAERVLLGLGLPLQYPACGLTKVEHADISETDKRKIMGENAKRLFKI